jgi:hypothetical protein
MNDHQHAAIEQARIAWHSHQLEHGCYGRECAEDLRLYRVYQRAITAIWPNPAPQPSRRLLRPVPHQQIRPLTR